MPAITAASSVKIDVMNAGMNDATSVVTSGAMNVTSIAITGGNRLQVEVELR